MLHCVSERFVDHLEFFQERLMPEGKTNVGDVGLKEEDGEKGESELRMEDADFKATDLIDIIPSCTGNVPLVS